MKNLWITDGDALVEWTAHLGVAAADPERLLDWVLKLVRAGERHRVYRVDQAPLADYRAERDGDFASHLEGRFLTGRMLDLGGFASSGTRAVNGVALRAYAVMAYAVDGRVTEAPVPDLGRLLRTLRPQDVDVAGGLMVDCPPVDITGPLIDLDRPERSIWNSPKGTVQVHISLRTDIWSPWVKGFLDPPVPPDRWRDNRGLAARHTPRLNAFLAEVRSATLDAGGRWELNPELRFLPPRAVGERGIDLDAASS